MKRETKANTPFSFPVFETINATYPNKYKYFAKKYDSTDMFCVLLYNTSVNGNDTPVILTCNSKNIVNTLALSNGAYYGRQFATIDNYLFFVYGTSNYSFKVRIYDKITLSLIRESGNIYNWPTGSPFCALINNKHYFSTTTNRTTNCYAVVCAEDGSVSRTESGVHYVGTYTQYDINEEVVYEFRYFNISGNTDTNAHSIALYKSTALTGKKDYSNPLSNSIPITDISSATSFIQSMPNYDYEQGDEIPCYVRDSNNNMRNMLIEDGGTLISLGTTYEHNVEYNILIFGALMNGEVMYTMDLATKNIVFKKLKKI